MTIKHSALLSLRNEKHKGRHKGLVRAPLFQQKKKNAWQWRDGNDERGKGGSVESVFSFAIESRKKKNERMERMNVSETLHKILGIEMVNRLRSSFIKGGMDGSPEDEPFLPIPAHHASVTKRLQTPEI